MYASEAHAVWLNWIQQDVCRRNSVLLRSHVHYKFQQRPVYKCICGAWRFRFLSIDATENPVEFHLSGDHSVLNQEYSHAVYDLAPLYYNIKLPADTVGLGIYLSAFKSEVASTGEIVDKYIRENSLHSSAAELLMLDNIFIPANMAIGFRGKVLANRLRFY